MGQQLPSPEVKEAAVNYEYVEMFGEDLLIIQQGSPTLGQIHLVRGPLECFFFTPCSNQVA